VIFAYLIHSTSNLPTDASALESAISALEREIKALESSSVPWEQSLPWFTALVALGVVMELWVIWGERREGMEAWARGTIRPPDRPSTFKFVVEVASVLFITGGIVGELWVGVKITSINGRLRTKGAELRSKSDKLLALVTQPAGHAADASSRAEDSAGKAQQKADAAAYSANRTGILANSAKADAISAQREVAEATRQTRATAAQLQDEHNKRMELEKSIAPRTISLTGLVTPQQHISTVDALKKFSGIVVSIETISDWEARRAGDNLDKALHEANWSATSVVIDKTDIPDGVTVYAYSPPDAWKPENWYKYDFAAIQQVSDAADELVAFMQANDWQAERGYALAIINGLSVNQLLIKVGFKPTPYFETFPLTLINASHSNPYKKRAEEIRNEIKKVLDEIRRAQEEDTRRRKSGK
jgi:hypothetical protein